MIDFDGTTPLHLACLIGYAEGATALISKGADPARRDNHGRNCMHYAVMGPTTHYCREYDSIPGKDAVNKRKVEIMAGLSDPDVPDEGGRTPLMKAVGDYRYDDFGFSAALLAKGADPNNADNKGMTPLMSACSNGHYEAVKSLVSAGAEMDRKGPQGSTALHMAVSWRNEKASRYLLKKGARSDIPDDSGKTAAEMAAAAGMESVLELMI